MSTGKRLAKRSIIGTRVVAPGDDGKYYAGMIQAVKTPAAGGFPEPTNCINLTPDTLYTVRFDSKAAVGKRHSREYRDCELLGPGFRSLAGAGLHLQPGQRVYLTHNGREVRADLLDHDPATDQLRVLLHAPGTEAPLELTKRLDEIRLLESRKSARLADSDTDFARLADMAGDRRRASTTIDVPHLPHVSRKRRPSACGSYERDSMMDECNAALVLMSLSCSPHSPHARTWGGRSSVSPGASSSDGSVSSWRSATPSPPPASSSFSDEGIAMDYSPHHDAKKARRVVFECTWPGCGARTTSCSAVEQHVRRAHLGERRRDDREEEFYYTERELSSEESSPPPPPPTLSHRDMCRPPHEDPDYQRQLVGSYRQGLLSMQAAAAAAASSDVHHPVVSSWPAAHSPKHMRLSHSIGGAAPLSPARRPRSDNKKCRKVYGMEHRDHWCTQCKWKKACTRFGD